MNDSKIQILDVAKLQELEAEKKKDREEFLNLPSSIAQKILNEQIPANLFEPDLSKDFTSHDYSLIDD